MRKLADAQERTFFFVHVMKTGGSTFRLHLLSNFGRREVFPHRDDDPEMFPAYRDLDYLQGLPPERRKVIRVYSGHFPFFATEMLGIELTTFTILREPVARTISYVRQLQSEEERFRGKSLEEVYDDEWFYPRLLHNHQTKVFSMTESDGARNILDVITIDDERLAIAKANLEKVDVIGLQEQYDEFLDEMHARFGWHFDEQPRQRVNRSAAPVSDALHQRIVRDNAIDIEFYEFARTLHSRRPRVASRSSSIERPRGLKALLNRAMPTQGARPTPPTGS